MSKVKLKGMLRICQLIYITYIQSMNALYVAPLHGKAGPQISKQHEKHHDCIMPRSFASLSSLLATE